MIAVQYPLIVLMLFLLYVYLITCCDCDMTCDVSNVTNIMLCDVVTESHDVSPCSIPIIISPE